MKDKIKRFMLSKIPELICLLMQIVALSLIVFVSPCSFGGYLAGFLGGFILVKIMARVSYYEKKEKAKTAVK